MGDLDLFLVSDQHDAALAVLDFFHIVQRQCV